MPRGFSLMEVLIAIGVFAIGMVAVASIFPVAILLQKQTVQEVEATHFGRNAKALVAARGFVAPAGAWDAIAAAGVTSAMPAAAMNQWSLADRSYNTLEPTNQRRVFWVPMCIDTDPSPSKAWQVFVFVVRGERGKTYGPVAANPDIVNGEDPNYVPRVKRQATTLAVTGPVVNRFNFGNNPRIVRPGESIVDQDGLVYIVNAADNAGVAVSGVIPGTAGANVDIWYAAPNTAGGTSTFVRLITLIDSGGITGTGDGNIIRTP